MSSSNKTTPDGLPPPPEQRSFGDDDALSAAQLDERVLEVLVEVHAKHHFPDQNRRLAEISARLAIGLTRGLTETVDAFGIRLHRAIGVRIAELQAIGREVNDIIFDVVAEIHEDSISGSKL